MSTQTDKLIYAVAFARGQGDDAEVARLLATYPHLEELIARAQRSDSEDRAEAAARQKYRPMRLASDHDSAAAMMLRMSGAYSPSQDETQDRFDGRDYNDQEQWR